MTKKISTVALLDRSLFARATVDSICKLSPQDQSRNPVMFVVYVGSILTTVLYIQTLTGTGEAPSGFILAITL